jgi:hypothetical protein
MARSVFAVSSLVRRAGAVLAAILAQLFGTWPDALRADSVLRQVQRR